jgi:hypothetical protein
MKIHDRPWVIANRKVEKGLSMLRLLQLDAKFPFEQYPERLNVIWSFRETGIDDVPADSESEEMKRFENRICDYIEQSDLAVLCMVFTEPGYREYVFHARNIERFLEALSEISEAAEPYPIEIHHEPDDSGDLYRSYAKKVLGQA